MSDKIPTALELLKNKESYDEEYPTVSIGDAVDAMKEFAKLHRKAALKAIKNNVRLTDFAYEFMQEGADNVVDKKSILNAYSESLIQ